MRDDGEGGDFCTITAIHAGAEAVLQSHITEPIVVVELTPHVGGDPVNALVVAVGEMDNQVGADSWL